jgi:hypothetical protein
MKVVGMGYCNVSPEAEAIAKFLGGRLGLPEKDLGMNGDGFVGATFPAGESWVELWRANGETPAMTMLQIVVDDADAFAAHARANGLEPQCPTDAPGERIFALTAPGGPHVSFQSRLS